PTTDSTTPAPTTK
nr:Chain P, 13-Peptide EA2, PTTDSTTPAPTTK [synthetic construct]6E7I_P Chain P, EA2 [Rattus norvegicus]